MLNDRQGLFVSEYIKDLNATQAAIRAGYSKKTAYSQGQRLLKNVEIKKAIDDLLDRVRRSNVADTVEIEEYLTAVMRGELKETEMINVGNFEQELVEVPAKQTTRIKAAELLGKRYALWTDKLDAKVDNNIKITIGDYDDDD